MLPPLPPLPSPIHPVLKLQPLRPVDHLDIEGPRIALPRDPVSVIGVLAHPRYRCKRVALPHSISIWLDRMEGMRRTFDSVILKLSGTNGLSETIVAPSFRSRKRLVRSAFRDGGKTSLLTSYRSRNRASTKKQLSANEGDSPPHLLHAIASQPSHASGSLPRAPRHQDSLSNPTSPSDVVLRVTADEHNVPGRAEARSHSYDINVSKRFLLCQGNGPTFCNPLAMPPASRNSRLRYQGPHFMCLVSLGLNPTESGELTIPSRNQDSLIP